jgi:polysaccharide pyruvyl transferase WcaK-like protein
MQAGEKVDDAAIRAVLDRLAGIAPAIVVPADSPVEEITGALAACDMLVSMRLHACLISHRLGVPAVGLEYDPKVRRHFEELGIGERSLPLHAPAGDIRAALDAVLAMGGFLHHATRERVAALEARAEAALDALARRLAAAPPMPLPDDGRDWLASPGSA